MYILQYFLLFMTVSMIYKYSVWSKWKKLNSLVSYRTNNLLLIYYYSLQLLFHTVWLSCFHYINNSPKQYSKNKYEIEYTINGKNYKIRSNFKKGPCPILKITDQNDIDITHDIMPFLGPNYDWHYNKFTPTDFGYNSIIFELRNGNGYTFTEMDEIKIEI